MCQQNSNMNTICIYIFVVKKPQGHSLYEYIEICRQRTSDIIVNFAMFLSNPALNKIFFHPLYAFILIAYATVLFAGEPKEQNSLVQCSKLSASSEQPLERNNIRSSPNGNEKSKYHNWRIQSNFCFKFEFLPSFVLQINCVEDEND